MPGTQLPPSSPPLYTTSQLSPTNGQLVEASQIPRHVASGDLAHSAILAAVSLAINTRHGLAICLTCQTALTLGNIRAHLLETDKLKVSRVRMQKILELCLAFGVNPTYPLLVPSAAPVPAVQGLAIQFKSACPDCPYTAEDKQVRSHMRKSHPTTHVSKIIPRQPSQLLHKGQAPTNFRVLLPAVFQEPVGAQRALVNDFTRFTVYTDQPAAPPDDTRLINPWIMQTGFHLYTKGHHVSTLRAAVERPFPHEHHLQTLAAQVTLLIDENTRLLGTTNHQILQKLNSENSSEYVGDICIVQKIAILPMNQAEPHPSQRPQQRRNQP